METTCKVDNSNFNPNISFEFKLNKSKLYLKDSDNIKNISPLIKGVKKPKKKKINWKPNFVEIIEIPSFKRYNYNLYSKKDDNCGSCIIF
jgi:hypothetical protein